ncbi:hypothetical protein BRADI_4g23592v3 [Brachypodium distachyon]|uniref:BUB1 N-terminal domain-containing protein n=2 Tax=Brachypodium distachyon TaxID=15368 RepID=A0A2K2CPP7_BRADI|nr:hypothetical protein BRADI_4g23592v3 [Brachypodium distachyon]
MRRSSSADTDAMKNARQLLRSAMSGIDDYAAVYRAWIAMETEDSGIGIGVARELVLDWGCVCTAEGTADEYAAFWIDYLAFELSTGRVFRRVA